MLVGLEGGNAMDLSSSLDGSKERDIVKACTEFYESPPLEGTQWRSV